MGENLQNLKDLMVNADWIEEKRVFVRGNFSYFHNYVDIPSES